MPTLTDIHTVDQGQLETLLDFNIKNRHNLIVFGPSGAGKTEMCMQAATRANTKLNYVNLSVNERPDIAGWPIMNDSPFAQYKTPHYMPRPETQTFQEQMYLTNALACLNEAEHAEIRKNINERLDVLAKIDTSVKLSNALPYIQKISGKDFKSYNQFVTKLEELEKVAKEYPQVTMLWDEADKAPHEVLQPLLEILLFNKLNGSQLSIGSNILTCNMPDELAQTENLSHALTNRCFIYKLTVDFDMWKKWAFQARIHPLIIGFLGNNKDLLHSTTILNHDDTAYAHPSPRAWAAASKALLQLEADENISTLRGEYLTDLKTSIMAGKVGLTAAMKFDIWLKYYQELDPIIEAIAEKGENPNLSDMTLDKKLILAIGACARLNSELKKDNKPRIEKLVKNVFTWIRTMGVDIQTAGIRNACDVKRMQEFGVADLEDAILTFKNIKEKTDNSIAA